MKLHKSLVLAYGSALSGKIAPARDPVAASVPETLWRPFRQTAFDDIAAATVYSLDEAAASYADSFRESLLGHEFTQESAIGLARLLGDVEIPHDIVWVEHDHASLTRDRLARGHAAGEEDIDPDEFGIWGFLVDNRRSDALRVKLFRSSRYRSGQVIDPLFEMRFPKPGTDDGPIPPGHFMPEAHEHMEAFYNAAGVTQDQFDSVEETELGAVSYDILTVLLVFALMASPESGLDYDRRESLAPAERKTARKFGRTWVEEAIRDHVVVRIGPAARRHLDEQAARHRHEREAATGRARAAPTEHWVSEHERRYRSGKVVLIKAHRRGGAADPQTPRRVVGPRGESGHGADGGMASGGKTAPQR